VWLHNAECTGCTEAALRTIKPFIDSLILDTISLDYQETIMAAAGDAAEDALHKAVESPDGFYLVVEGGLPTIDGGNWGMVSGHPMLATTKKLAPKAKGVICIGTCAAYGGIQKAKPNPSQAISVTEATGIATINIAGCPPNPINFIGAVVHVLEKGIPELDSNGRPKIFFGELVHDNCERLKHFEASEFAPSFDSEEAKKGYCLYELGCKGPVTYNNCPKVLFNQVNWPVKAGHPCIGCSEPDFWDTMTPFYEQG
jgi:[NiFe] hydrogenase small subunit